MLRVLGLTVEKYVGEHIEGFNCDFERSPQEMDRYYIHVVNEYNIHYEIELEEYYGECGSGWCTASWATMVVRDSCNRPWTHRIKKHIDLDYFVDLRSGPRNGYRIISLNDDTKTSEIANIENEVFEYSEDGGDSYYPSGYVYVNLDLFEELPRAMKKRPVYIVTGKSGVGKSTLFLNLYDKLETDSLTNGELPNEITESVIVLGNRWPITKNQIIERVFGDAQIIEVHMEEINE